MVKKLTTEEFISKAKAIHGDKYRYDKVVYVNSKEPIKIYCNHCKKYFEQIPNNHLRGKGCYDCACKRCGDRCRLTQEEFISECKKIHGDKYDYTQAIYKGAHISVKVFCKKCKTYFECRPNNLWHGRGCPKCAKEATRKKLALTLNDVLKRIEVLHKNRYVYIRGDYKNQTSMLTFKCSKCKKEFTIMSNNILRGHGCPYCKLSRGELIIQNILNDKHIKYQQQYRYKDCKDKYTLPFDFYLPDYNLCIEYQGMQHYKKGIHFFEIKRGKEYAQKGFELQKKHDRIKKKYCKDNNINFLEIKYNENIEKKLQECLDKLDSN